jgi:hypothetical protein
MAVTVKNAAFRDVRFYGLVRREVLEERITSSIALMLQAKLSSGTSVLTRATTLHISEEEIIQIPKSFVFLFLFLFFFLFFFQCCIL